MNIRTLAAQVAPQTGQTAGMAKAPANQTATPDKSPVKTTNCLWGGFWGWAGAAAVADLKSTAGGFAKDFAVNLHDTLETNEKDFLNKLSNKVFPPLEGLVDIRSKVNANLSIFGKMNAMAENKPVVITALKYLSSSKLMILPVLLTAVCSRNKTAQEGQELSKKDKFTNFVRQNAGKLSMAFALPALAFRLSTGAQNIMTAKKLVPAGMMPKVYAFEGTKAALSIIFVGLTGLAVKCGVDIKDFMQNRKDKKALEQVQQ